MTFEVFHQTGHNTIWNIDSFLKDECGDGLILSPVNLDISKIENLSDEVRNFSKFDPQFYLPSSQKKNLQSYPFFPETKSGGFTTGNFLADAKESALECVAFQLEHGFESVVIPARFIDQLRTNFIERHEEFSLLPFLEAAKTHGVTDLCMTLPLTEHMIDDEPFRKRILNWITKYPEISEIYLIYTVDRGTKQIQSIDFLKSALSFSKEILDTGLSLVVGYQNTEALLFTPLDGITVTMGTFENTRIFGIDKFLVTDEERRGPKPRIYLPGLMNWVQFEQARQIRAGSTKLWDLIYTPTTYAEGAFLRAADPHFMQPDLYKHHLIAIQDQFNELNELDALDRIELLEKWVRAALRRYSEIEDLGIYLDPHGNSGHVSAWGSVLKHAKQILS